MSQLVLVGDTGGTNTRLALFDRQTGKLAHVTRFQNRAYPSYEDAISAFLRAAGTPRVAASTLAFAAPIIGDSVSLTNHDWTVTKAAVQDCTGGSAPIFLNDLEALAWSLMLLPQTGVAPLTGATDTPSAGGRMVVGIGTGFNAAVLDSPPGGAAPVVRVAECGHMTLPVESADELSLRDFLARGRGRASVERALSGLGLHEVHDWACQHLGQTHRALSSVEVTRRGIAGEDPACQLTCDLLVRFAARVTGDLALALLPFGGIYLAGSVAQALSPLLRQPGFLDRFTAKGRQTGLMGCFPLHLITDGSAALYGCAAASTTSQQGRA